MSSSADTNKALTNYIYWFTSVLVMLQESDEKS